MKTEEIKNLDTASLQNELMMMKKELFNLKLNRGSGQVKDLSQIRKLRANIARVLTFLSQKKEQ